MKHTLLFFISSVLLFSVGCGVAYAVTVPQELFISSSGQIHLRGGEVKIKTAANVFVVEIWGQRWTILVDYATKFESANGLSMKMEEVAEGHLLEVKGRPIKDKVGTIDASLVRNLLLESGAPQPSVYASIVQSLCSAEVTASIEKTKKEMQGSLSASVIQSLPALKTTPSATSAPPANVKDTPSLQMLARDLDLGMKGEDVKLIQLFLLSRGYDIGFPSATGFFGKGTMAAIKKFQKSNGLPSLGKIGPATRVLIQAELGKLQITPAIEVRPQ